MLKLTKKRGSVKANLTIFSKYVNEVKGKEKIDESEALKLSNKLERALNLIDAFCEVQDQIDEISNNLDNELKEREEFDDQYDTVITTAQIILERTKDKSVTGDSTPHSSSCAEMKSSVVLPQINLPKFKGDHESWLEFRGTFEALIHNNELLSNMQKYHYLKASLEGTAAQIIRPTPFTADNYEAAWTALCEEFDNSKLLIHQHVSALFHLEFDGKEKSSSLKKIVNEVSQHLRCLEMLGLESADLGNLLLIHLIKNKLDNNTAQEWEKQVNKTGKKNVTAKVQCPSWVELKDFLKERATMLETLESNNANGKHKPRDRNQFVKGLVSNSVSTVNKTLACNYCKAAHSIYNCREFLNLSIIKRQEAVKRSNLCKVCLLEGHTSRSCKKQPCFKCKRYHNILLHQANEMASSTQQTQRKAQEPSNVANPSTSLTALCNQVLLSTATIMVACKNTLVKARVLLDSGSQVSFITNAFCDRIGLKRYKATLPIYGINNSKSISEHKCDVKIFSRVNAFKSALTCYVLPEITSYTPSFQVNASELSIPRDVPLADPEFCTPAQVDMLIGGELFWDIVRNGKIELGRNKPILKETLFGWIIAGQIGLQRDNFTIQSNVCTKFEINDQVQRFWEIEECDLIKPLSEEEALCEQHFQTTTTRSDDGKFIVKMPLKQNPKALGESRNQAEWRLLALERRFQRNPELAQRYKEFMQEYEEMGHMTLVSEESAEDDGTPTYYTPHHAVLREESKTTKLRAVFDASAATTTGLSLNQIQCVGPIVQDDLISIILRYRLYNIVISADVAKMYRMVLIHPEHRKLQRILWRNDSKDEIKTYELATVTYGQASSSYLATRCLIEVANDCQETQPRVAEVIRRDFYVDDLLTGADTIEDAISLAKEISSVLEGYGFTLRKWQSNDTTFLQAINDELVEHSVLNFDTERKTKILGLAWSSQFDKLHYIINTDDMEENYTKRSILSSIARIYDPLGLLAPCISLAKIVMQGLWLENLGWDDRASEQSINTWRRFRSELKDIKNLSIPRQIMYPGAKRITIHGFADASEKAYGACIYLVSETASGTYSCLVCAKSKLAPIKTLTMPRLELLAALLLTRLYGKVSKALHLKFESVNLWSDSSIVLAWIASGPHSLKLFVANRIVEIQDTTKLCKWRHVPSAHNPADIVSRGLYPSEIIDCHLWWQGPEWISQDESSWPNSMPRIEHLPELKSQVVSTLVNNVSINFPYNKFSNFIRLKRSLAWIYRFKENASRVQAERVSGPLRVHELERSLNILVKLIQSESFPVELKQLKLKGTVDASSNILSLSPFLDNDGIVRVGGRLKNSPYTVDKKNPILLHADHHITKILLTYEHQRLMHVGPQALLAIVREKFWVIKGRNLARIVTKRCVRCIRFKPAVAKVIMGHLPKDRIVPSSPFTISGVDFAGPFTIKERKGRCNKFSKCYVCLFICFSTKAVHLELVSSLSTDDFMLALRRFISRRGKPRKIYSDNGTNFVGASKELSRYFVSAERDITEAALRVEIEWSFLPPYSPHFGGLWEAGVKSVKHHLRRVLTESRLTFEEFTTLLTQIEAILNSRPLCPLSTDPNDYSILTPAHFLIGRPLVAAPDDNLTTERLNRLNRYQLIQRISQHFWKRWVREYLAELQQRSKWKINHSKLKEGALVLLIDDNTSPTEWRRGRIISLIPGVDGISRVAEVRTSVGAVRRNFSKLCILPVDPEEDYPERC